MLCTFYGFYRQWLYFIALYTFRKNSSLRMIRTSRIEYVIEKNIKKISDCRSSTWVMNSRSPMRSGGIIKIIRPHEKLTNIFQATIFAILVGTGECLRHKYRCRTSRIYSNSQAWTALCRKQVNPPYVNLIYMLNISTLVGKRRDLISILQKFDDALSIC